MLSRIDHGEHRIHQAVNWWDAEIEAGQARPLADTFCAITVLLDDVVAIEHAGGSNYRRHRAYGATEMEAYIGVPLAGPKGEVGTLSFASPLSRSRPGATPIRWTVSRLSLFYVHSSSGVESFRCA